VDAVLHSDYLVWRIAFNLKFVLLLAIFVGSWVKLRQPAIAIRRRIL
jgi:hypothetical protein